MRKSGWRSVRNACNLRDTETGGGLVAVVNNPLERNIAEPSRRFGGRVLQPFPAIQVVDERRPVGTPDIARRDDPAEQPAQMDFLVHREKRDLVHEPPPGAMTVSGVTAIGVEPRRKKRKVNRVIDRPLCAAAVISACNFPVPTVAARCRRSWAHSSFFRSWAVRSTARTCCRRLRCSPS